jgi:hypothetical protein
MIARLFLTAAIFFGVFSEAFAADNRAAVIKTEFDRLYAYVRTLQPDGKIGETAKYKKVGSYLVIWELDYNVDEDDIIRLFNEHIGGTESFDVSYYQSKSIVPERTVLRRFVGPTVIGWRNDTLDLKTGEYLGMQGRDVPIMNASDRKMLQRFKVQLFK